MQGIQQILKQYWGYDTFREPQQHIIQSALDGRDTLALLPTGGGKSICFQVPALAMDGLCLVISPLIALMNDQVLNLQKRGIKAAAVHTGLSSRQMDTVLDNCAYGGYKFLYISPERLVTENFRARLEKMKICLIAVDEAHCISQWGYDFRPPYLRIAEVRDHLPKVPLMALTATATAVVVDDIQQKLHFKNPQVFRKSFVRKNLSYVVRETMNKEQSLVDILNKVKGSAIVYVRNRKKTKEFAEYLQRKGLKADYYHAGLEPYLRTSKQDSWTHNKTTVMVSTNAFGMGIDKPDVRTVVHMDLADSLEAYFQEAGRAGRDEKRAYAVQLLADYDLLDLEKKIKEGFPEIAFIREVYDKLATYLRIAYEDGAGRSYDFDLSDFAKKNEWETYKVLAALKILQQQELVYLSDGFYQPSHIKAVAYKEVIYKFQKDNKTLEAIVKFILRSSEGVFEDYVTVNEQAIASRLKVSVEEVIEQLNALNKFSIFSYKQRKDKPQLMLMKNRMKKENLSLDAASIKQRKADYENRLKAIKNYVTENNICRTRLLVKYFGEDDAEDCGVCDVCIEKKKGSLGAPDFTKIAVQLEKELKKAPIPLRLLGDKLNVKSTELNTVVDFLMDSGKIERTAKGELIWKD